MIGAGLLGLARYGRGLLTAAKGGRMPVLNTVSKAIKNPQMSRREFLRFNVSMGKEALAQNNYLKAINVLNDNKEVGKILLNSNKSLVDKVASLTSKVDAGYVVSKAAAVSKRLNILKKNPGKFKAAKKDFINYQANEAWMSEPTGHVSTIVKDMTQYYNSIPKSKLLKILAEDSVVTTGAKSALKSKHMKNLGLTADDILKVANLKSQAKHGYTGWGDPKLENFFKTRENYSKLTGMNHYEVQSMASGGKGFYATPGFKGVDVSKKLKKEVDEIASPMKDAWKVLKKEFLEAYHK